MFINFHARQSIPVDITWVDAPEFQYSIAGSDYEIKCDVQANPSPNVDWVRGDKKIELSDKYIIRNKGLLIKNVQESDDGVYTCRAVVLSTGHFEVKNIKVSHDQWTVSVM